MAEFLRDFRIPQLENLRWEELISEGKVISPGYLRKFLIEANHYLTNEPGPNLELRRQQAPEWLGWWTMYLGVKESKEEGVLTNSNKLKDLEEIRKITSAQIDTSGVLFMGGGEGHPGHRHAVDWMGKHVKVKILLFDQDEYLESKERGGPFLPLGVRLSMWSHYFGVDILSTMPSRPPTISQAEHYGKIFTLTGANYCFVTEGDPNADEKRSRGKRVLFTLIPRLDVLSTAERVKKLMP